MLKSKIKLIIFDMDGVLVDTVPLMEIAFNKACCEFYGDSHSYTFSEFQKELGAPIREIIRTLELPPNFDDVYYRKFAEVAHSIQPCANIKSTLIELKQQNRYRFAVATGKDEARAKLMLAQIGLSRIFRTVLGGDSVAVGKPAPEIILEILRLEEVMPKEAVMVGDSPYDILASVSAGVRPIGAAWASGSKDVLIDAGAEVVLDSPNELFRVLDG